MFDDYRCLDPIEVLARKESTESVSNLTLPPKFTIVSTLDDTSNEVNTYIHSDLTSEFSYPSDPDFKFIGDIRKAEAISIARAYPGIIDLTDPKLQYSSIGSQEWIELIQALIPRSEGYGMYDKDIGDFDYSRIRVVENSFTPIYGESGRGNLYLEYGNYIEECSDIIDIHTGHVASSVDLCIHGIIAIGILSGGGNMILRTTLNILSDTDSKLLYVIGSCFEWITIYKSIVNDGNSKYIIFRNYIGNPNARSVLKAYKDSGIINIRVNSLYAEWLTYVNSTYEKMRRIPVNTDEYDNNMLERLLTLW